MIAECGLTYNWSGHHTLCVLGLKTAYPTFWRSPSGFGPRARYLALQQQQQRLTSNAPSPATSAATVNVGRHHLTAAILLATSSIPTFPSEQDLNAFAIYRVYSLLDSISINQFRQPGIDGFPISALLSIPRFHQGGEESTSSTATGTSNSVRNQPQQHFPSLLIPSLAACLMHSEVELGLQLPKSASRAAARAAAGGPSNPFDDPTLVYRDPNNEDSSSDEEDTSGPPAAPSPRRAVPPRLLGPGFPPNLPPFPGPPPPPAAAASGRAAAAIAAAAAAAAATGPPADAAPSFAGAPSTLDPTAAATAAEVAAAAAAAGIDLRPRRHRTPEERAARDHAKLLASLRSIGIPLTGRGAVEKTLKPDAVKNLPDYHGAKLLQGVRTEQDVTEWVERFISYMETQKVTAPHDICHYAFLSLRGEAHALATSLRQAGTWPTSFTGIAQVLLEHFAPPAAFEDSCRAVVDLKQGAKETSKAYILRGRRTLQQLSTLYGQVRRTRAVSVDGSSGASAAPLPELQECLFLTILEGGLLPGLRQQMRLQTHSRFNEEEMVASLQRIERTIVLRNKENSTATNGASSANFMPPQHGSPSPFNSSPSADYVDDDTSLNYGNNNQGNGNRNGSGRRPYCGNRHGDNSRPQNSRPQSAPTPQGGNSALRFAPPAGAASALTPSRDRSQQRQQAPPPRPSTLNPSSGERPQDPRRQLPSRGPNNSGTPGAAQQRPRPAHHGSVNLGAPAYLRATAFTDPCVIPVGMPSHWRTDDWYKMFGYDAGATLATVKVSIGSGADALDLSAAVVDTGAGNVYIRTREAETYFSLLPVAERPRVFLMPEDITRQHMPIFHAGSDVMDNRRHLMLPIAFEGRDAHPGLPRAANAPAEPLRQVSYLTHCIMVDDLPAALVLGNSFFVRNRMSINPYTGYLHTVRPVLATPDDPRREFGIYGVGENRSLHLNRRRMEWRPFDIELNAVGVHQPFSAVRHGSGGITDASDRQGIRHNVWFFTILRNHRFKLFETICHSITCQYHGRQETLDFDTMFQFKLQADEPFTTLRTSLRHAFARTSRPLKTHTKQPHNAFTEQS
ncbi:hypothetical protein JKP88DRAFT_264385 [Tribonema minus]|uniref:Uncharacterized protein n=1 Tax=Tribonema minus TaxID=303371 RepID=A0A835YXP4_9STRA|nr:hypothetical protein JKP88DRAFT_264385 [Tribonema minus]